MFSPSNIWALSRLAYRSKLPIVPRLLKGINFFIFHAILPVEAKIGSNVELAHYGLGVVIHPNVSIGSRVKIYHHVTLASETWIGSPYQIVIGDDVMIGAGAIIIGKGDENLIIGNRACIGAHAVVTKDVPPGATVVGVPARILEKEKVVQPAL